MLGQTAGQAYHVFSFVHAVLHIFVILVVFGIFALIVLTITKMLEWRTEKKKADEEARKLKFRPDGEPYPPFDEGLCDRCSHAFLKVYYLPSGQRLCPECYQELYMKDIT